MWDCKKCSQPVFFAERKQSLGFDWHPNCLRCEECGKRLNPGQHAEHKGVPYCHHPCYGALFGPKLFGHGTRHECHASFGRLVNKDGLVKRSHLEAKLKSYNQTYEGKPGELKYREANGNLVVEGVIRIYWGVRKLIHLKEEDSRKHARESWSGSTFNSMDGNRSATLRDDSTRLSLRKSESELTQSKSDVNGVSPNLSCNSDSHPIHDDTEVSISRNNSGLELLPLKIPNTAIKRRSGRLMTKSKLRRRCSINGHFYLRETSSFTPPVGSVCSLWVTSKTTSDEMLHMLMDKYKVEMPPSSFALFVVKDSGEQKRIKEEESPLISRVLLGPNEDVAKIFIVDAYKTQEISPEVAQFLSLSMAELHAILRKYEEEEINCIVNVKRKCEKMRLILKQYLSDGDSC